MQHPVRSLQNQNSLVYQGSGNETLVTQHKATQLNTSSTTATHNTHLLSGIVVFFATLRHFHLKSQLESVLDEAESGA